MKVIPETRRAR